MGVTLGAAAVGAMKALPAVASAGAAIYGALTGSDYAKKNYNLQKRSQKEQMFMNRNQTQISAADAQKAGINPLAMSGNTIQSASAENVDAPDYSGVSQAFSNIYQTMNSNKQQEKQIQADKEIADKNNETAVKIAELKLASEEKRASERLTQEQKQFDANLEEMKRVNDANISLNDKKYKLEQIAQDSLEKLRQLEKYQKKTDLYDSCLKLSTMVITGFKMDANGLAGFFERLGMKLKNNEIVNLKKGVSNGELADILYRNLTNENFGAK